MKRTTNLILIAATLLASACATAPVVAPIQPAGDERFLIDPRDGYDATLPPDLSRKFDQAWNMFAAGDLVEARKQIEKLRAKTPDTPPLLLALAAIDIREKKIDDARNRIDRVLGSNPHYTAAEVYRAEIAIEEGQTRLAYDIYREIASRPVAPETARERSAQLQKTIFDQLYSSAVSASDPEAVRMLREALTINPAATGARILLVQKLVAMRQFDDARTALDPMLSGGEAAHDDVQAALAEIEVGQRRYEEAITRYERLAHKDQRYSARLDQVKEEFAAANMPPQYQRALESESVTRADLAVLLYWEVASVRFASNLGTPPIAVDIGESPGREELIRAITLGIFTLDPVTRRVNPSTTLTAAMLARTAARVLTLRGANCARQAPSDPSDIGRARNVLTACSIADPIVTLGDDQAPVSGRTAAAVMEQVDRALK